MDLKQLVAESKKGNIESFMFLLSAKQEMLYKIAYTYTQHPQDAEDVLSVPDEENDNIPYIINTDNDNLIDD